MEEVRVAQDLLHNDLLLITSFFVFAFVLFRHFFFFLSFYPLSLIPSPASRKEGTESCLTIDLPVSKIEQKKEEKEQRKGGEKKKVRKRMLGISGIVHMFYSESLLGGENARVFFPLNLRTLAGKL